MSSLYKIVEENDNQALIHPGITRIMYKNSYNAYFFFNFLLNIFNCIMIVIVYLYVNQTSNSLSILNSPNISETINKVENLIDYVCNELGTAC